MATGNNGYFSGYYFNVNYKATDGSDAMFKFMITLQSASWNINQSSDGQKFSTISNVISSSTQLKNSGSWFVAQQSAPPYRSFCFQHNATSTDHSRWRITYSPFYGFLQGNAGITRVPSAQDSFTLLGGGSDAAPSFVQMFPNDGTYRIHALAGGQLQFYNFYCITTATGSTTSNSVLLLDIFQPGTFVSADSDPAVILQKTTASFALSRQTLCKPNNVWGKFGLNNFLSLAALEIGHITQVTGSGVQNYVMFPGGEQGSNVYTNFDDLMPIPFGRTAAMFPTPYGYKGMSGMMQWPGIFRTPFTTMTVVNIQDFIYVDDVILPWAGVNPDLS